jgi:hypothetical protein
MKRHYPLPGDLIVVEKSEWYALKDGEMLRVCEQAGWTVVGRDMYVAPRSQVRTFWGPDHGPPDGKKRERISTSGGPFNTVTLAIVPGLVLFDSKLDEFWHWKDWPRSGGGVEYQREVAVWRLPFLPDSSWVDPDVEARFVPGVSPLGPIRLRDHGGEE